MSDRTRNERLLAIALAIFREKKITNPVHERKAALLYVRRLVDRKLQEIGEEMGHLPCAEEARMRMPSSSPSRTGEQEGHCPPAERAATRVPPASPPPSDDVGHPSRAGNGYGVIAPSSVPQPGGRGHVATASDSQDLDAGPSDPHKAGEGQRWSAGNGQATVARPALAPTPAQRAGAARGMKAASAATARTVLDTLKIRGGIPIGDVPYNALDQHYKSNEWEIAFIDELRGFGIPPNRTWRVRDYLTAKQVALAKEAADRRFHNAA